METIRVRDWLDLNELLFTGSWKENLSRFRSNYVFRGGVGKSASLVPGVVKFTRSSHETEGHLLRNFRKYADRQSLLDRSMWNWLALAQHHGLPTRLLDWTYSPYVALHFATMDPDALHEDSYIFCIDYHRTNELLPARLKKILKSEGSYVFTAEMLDQAARSLREFDALSKKEFVLFFEPPTLDDRILNQYALFSLMSHPTADLLKWLQKHAGAAIHLVIPSILKREIRDKLDQANITERTLTPGLDGLCAWLKRYYTVEVPD
jgi:hypothetical protein